MPSELIDEIVVFDVLALFLSIVTVEIVWYVVQTTSPNDVEDLQFFLTFILVIVPFVMAVYFGGALINFNAMAVRSGWPQVLPLKSPLTPPIIGAIIFYIGQTVWLWASWRKLRIAAKKREASKVATPVPAALARR